MRQPNRESRATRESASRVGRWLSDRGGIVGNMSAEAPDRRELTDLAFQAAAWGELDRLFGVGATVVPALEPFARAGAPALQQGDATASAPRSSGGLASFAARASAALARASDSAS